MSQITLFKEQWLRHRQALEKLLPLIPTEQLRFKPWEGAMPLSELVQHTTFSTEMFLTIAKTGQGTISRPPVTNINSTDELIERVKHQTENTVRLYDSLTEKELQLTYESPFPLLNGPRIKLVMLANEHEMHHKGQLFLYARLIGIPGLPFFS